MNPSSKQDQQDPRIAVGRLGRPHGTRGEMRAWPSDMANDTLFFVKEVEVISEDGRSETYQVRSCKPSNRFLILGLKGVSSRMAAERLKGAELSVRRSSLPDLEDPDDFYHFELIGLGVLLISDNTAFGTVHNIFDNGTQDILVIHDTEGDHEYMIPFVDGLVELVEDEESGDVWIAIDPPEGLLDATRVPVKSSSKQGGDT